MSELSLSRRGLMGAGLAAAALASRKQLIASPESTRTVFESAPLAAYASDAESFGQSLDAAYNFLDAMMDAYVSGGTVRLVQSYSDQSGLLSTGFTYDNALVIHAYLARGSSSDLARAQIIGEGLLYAQANNFPFADGRFAQGYFTNTPGAHGAYITPAAAPFYFYTSSVGDQCWAGMALAQLYRATGNQAFLAGAIKVANWVVNNHYNAVDFGGFTWGTAINSSNQSVPSNNGESTEHNIDAYGFFTMLADLTHGSAQNGMRWSSLAQHALSFVRAMYNAAGGFFWAGTQSGSGPGLGVISTFPIPEDVQTWSYLAIQSRLWSVSIDWCLTHLSTIDTPSCPNSALATLGNVKIEGVTFDTASLNSTLAGVDTHGVWLEGTAHTAAALAQRRNWDDGDAVNLYTLLANSKTVQQVLGQGQTVAGKPFVSDAQGVVAATATIDTGYNYTYGPVLHIGATSWYVMALLGANPYQLGYQKAWY